MRDHRNLDPWSAPDSDDAGNAPGGMIAIRRPVTWYPVHGVRGRLTSISTTSPEGALVAKTIPLELYSKMVRSSP